MRDAAAADSPSSASPQSQSQLQSQSQCLPPVQLLLTADQLELFSSRFAPARVCRGAEEQRDVDADELMSVCSLLERSTLQPTRTAAAEDDAGSPNPESRRPERVVVKGYTPDLLRQREQREDLPKAVAAVPKEQEDVSLRVPITSHCTPQSLLQRRLIRYDREADLMKYIVIFVEQVRTVARTAIECRLSNKGMTDIHLLINLLILCTAATEPFSRAYRGIRLHVHRTRTAKEPFGLRVSSGAAHRQLSICGCAYHYHYLYHNDKDHHISSLTVPIIFAKGEIRRSGGLRLLSSRLPQSRLSDALLDQIWAEVDTQHRLQRLMTQLEECISFLLSTSIQSRSDDEPPDAFLDHASGAAEESDSAANGEGNVFLEDFVLNTLLVDPKRWKDVSGSVISQQVTSSYSLFPAMTTDFCVLP
jgi:hypothetical protein